MLYVLPRCRDHHSCTVCRHRGAGNSSIHFTPPLQLSDDGGVNASLKVGVDLGTNGSLDSGRHIDLDTSLDCDVDDGVDSGDDIDLNIEVLWKGQLSSFDLKSASCTHHVSLELSVDLGGKVQVGRNGAANREIDLRVHINGDTKGNVDDGVNCGVDVDLSVDTKGGLTK